MNTISYSKTIKVKGNQPSYTLHHPADGRNLFLFRNINAVLNWFKADQKCLSDEELYNRHWKNMPDNRLRIYENKISHIFPGGYSVESSRLCALYNVSTEKLCNICKLEEIYEFSLN